MSRNISGQKISWNFCTSQTPQFKPRSEQEFVSAAWPKSLFSTPPLPVVFCLRRVSVQSSRRRLSPNSTSHDTTRYPVHTFCHRKKSRRAVSRVLGNTTRHACHDTSCVSWRDEQVKFGIYCSFCLLTTFLPLSGGFKGWGRPPPLIGSYFCQKAAFCV